MTVAGRQRDWLEDEVLARVAWNHLADPADHAAQTYCDLHGVGGALERVLAQADPAAQALADRWRLRLSRCDPWRDLRNVAQLGGRVLVPGDEQWPPGLTDLGSRTPVLLWAVGPARIDWSRSVSVVGSRSATSYGERVAADLGSDLAERGVAVVSGGAYGIDIAVHRGVLAAGGQAVVVLAGGLDRLYPRGNERVLAKARAEQLVLSEAKPGVSPTRWRFLERNRLIAAMSAATVVVEAARRSGALSTANAAAGLGRPLGAVPGPVTSMTSVGCHYLLRNREATCVTGAGDLVELISGLDATREAQDSLFGPVSDPLDLRVLDALPRRNGVDTAELAGRVGITPRQAQAALGRLSLTGEAVMTGGRWRRAFPAGGR